MMPRVRGDRGKRDNNYFGKNCDYLSCEPSWLVSFPFSPFVPRSVSVGNDRKRDLAQSRIMILAGRDPGFRGHPEQGDFIELESERAGKWTASDFISTTHQKNERTNVCVGHTQTKPLARWPLCPITIIIIFVFYANFSIAIGPASGHSLHGRGVDLPLEMIISIVCAHSTGVPGLEAKH